jgi:hypothetical protein
MALMSKVSLLGLQSCENATNHDKLELLNCQQLVPRGPHIRSETHEYSDRKAEN